MPKNTPASPHDTDLLGRENNAALWKLRYHYGECYTITCDYPHSWRAERIGEPETVLTADSDTELRGMMIADHEARPLPRRPSLRADDGE
jgi:hypothetical protein